MSARFVSVDGRFWRMLRIRWQGEPLSGAGAALHGGRWNRTGVAALYLATSYASAITEFHRQLVQPGTLVGYDVVSDRIVDLADAEAREAWRVGADVPFCEWRATIAIERRTPPTWPVAERLIEAGAHGALVPSARVAGGVNLVLWRWAAEPGDGAVVSVVDPASDLRPRQEPT